MTSQNSNQWDFGRFVKTLSYFGAVPLFSSMDWFQQWWGSRPNPKVDSRSIGLTSSSSVLMEQRPMNAVNAVLVVGAASPIGQEIVQQLDAQGCSVLLATEVGQSVPNIGQSFEAIAIDPDEPANLDDRVNAVICADAAQFRLMQALMSCADAIGVDRQPLFDFACPDSNMQEIWGALDDVVMGGVSQSSFRLGDGVAYFSGKVSTANSGGFASVRTRNLEPSLNLAEFDGIELRLKGDGNRYKFMLRTETRWDGVAYCRSFDTIADQWTTMRIPFSELVPVFRAKTIANSPFDASTICALQLMLSKFEYDGALNPHFSPGFFQLQLESIQVYRQAQQPRWVVVDLNDRIDSQLQSTLEQSQLPYALIGAATLTDRPDGSVLKIDRQPLLGQVSVADVAAFSIAALSRSTALNQTMFVAAEEGGETMNDECGTMK